MIMTIHRTQGYLSERYIETVSLTQSEVWEGYVYVCVQVCVSVKEGAVSYAASSN